MSMGIKIQFNTLAEVEYTGVKMGIQIMRQTRRTTGSAHPQEG